MATHSSVLAWRIPGMAEPGGLPSAGSHRVGHDWTDLAAAAAGGEGDDRGWDGWMTSPTQCTWVWVGSGSWWWTGRCREPPREIPLMTKVMRKRPDRKRRIRPQGTPWICSSIHLKPESVCLTILCLSPTLLTLTGAIPDHLSLEKINLGLQLISLLNMKGIFLF